jgi:NAD(P)-dependent dehydrogenase (short-subunit alcohol dehydrogenase family)
MRSWFITGASSGIGRALAEAALARGDRVAATFRHAAQAERFTALAPARSRGVRLDVTDLAAIAAAVAPAGDIDILVNNAGYSLQGVVETTSLAAAQAQVATHLLGPLALIQAVLPGMRARRAGHIVNIGSLAAHMPGDGFGLYAAVKAALETLSASLAAELAPLGIHVTSVVPGAFRTGISAARQSSGTSIADYADLDARRLARLDAVAGRQRGDPARAAAAMLRMVDAPHPPRCFALGPDAIDGLRRHAAALAAAADASEALGGATDFE